MKKILAEIRQALRENVDEKTLGNGRRFFKEEIEFYGVRIPVMHEIARKYFGEINPRIKERIFHLCEELWKSGYNEEHYIACDWSYWIREQFEPADFNIFERWVNLYVNNWASCDTLCNHTVGAFVEQFPEYVQRLKEWARSENRWVKRAAAVSLILPARKGLFLDDILQIADILLPDPDDLVQKGYGWMLKAASEAYPQKIFEYVVSKETIMPRTALRYAIEKFPPGLRAEAMKKN